MIIITAVVIYDRNESGQYYKAMIVANLPVARSVNYDNKLQQMDSFQRRSNEINLT